jgi:RimJ/RimL family protein N-acetyltransferase
MAWADEAALTPERRRTHQEQVARGWSAGSDFAYVVLDPDETTVLGACGLHRRIGPGGIEIGYWVHAGHGGRGVGTAAAALATEAARALPDVDRVEIHCDETNARSAAIPRRLGYRLERVVDKDPQAPGETGREMNWVLDA